MVKPADRFFGAFTASNHQIVRNPINRKAVLSCFDQTAIKQRFKVSGDQHLALRLITAAGCL